VIPTLAAGGAERVLRDLAGAWSARGWEIHLVTTHDEGGETFYPLAAGVRRRPVLLGGGVGHHRGPWVQGRIIGGIRRRLRETRPDAVISFLSFANILVLLASRGLGVPVVVSERLDPRVKDLGPIWSRLRRWTYPWADRIVCQTETAAALFRSWLGESVRVIPNPILPPPPPSENEFRFARPTVLSVGRLHWQKGHDLALKAFTHLDPSAQDWQLVIVGEGDRRGELEAQRQDLGLGDRVQLPGQASDPWPYYRAAQIYLLASRTEGFPNALCEAMAVGLAVVAADCPSGPAEIIRDGVDGLLVPPEDPGALASALERLMADSDLRRSLGARGPEILERLAFAKVLACWDRLLEEIVPGFRPGDPEGGGGDESG
jgi:glycosyltransferase involved in cell wall biosynthesis